MLRIITALLLATTIAAADDSVFKSLDVFELEVATDPQISPDGSRVAYVRQSMDIMSDRSVSNIWIVDAKGGNHRPLLSGSRNFSSPRWSPSGDRIAYISKVYGRGTQIHVRWMDTGQTAVLSNVRHEPASLTWSPDGKQIAFAMFVEEAATTLVTPPVAPKGADWAPPVTVIERMRFRSEDKGFLDAGRSQLFVLSAEGGTPRILTSGDFEHGGPLSWMPDGESIVFSANRRADWEYELRESELWTVNVASADLRQLTDRTGPDHSPAVSPDGTKIAYLGFDDRRMGYEISNVYLMDVSDGLTRILTGNFDRSIGAVSWPGDSNRLLITYDDHGRRHIATLSTSGKVSSVADDVGAVILGRPYTSGGFSVANNGAYAYSAGRPDRPADIGVGRGSKTPTRVTDLNADLFDHKTLGAVEEIRWQSTFDELEIQGWLVKPPNFDPAKKYPLILEIHGGPFLPYGPHFAAELQLYAAAGYVVLYSNPRGSTSYGYDFANEIHHNYPGQDYDDLMSGVDAVIERGLVDENSLYVTGGSGGGTLSAWIVGKTDRFRAAVVVKPVIDWSSFVLTADAAPIFSMNWFEKAPWEDHEAYWARSPLSLVGNVTTPTALLTGERDLRTPISQSEQYYVALKMRKIDTALIRVTEAKHSIAARPSHLIAKVENILAWFARYAKR